MQTLKETVYEEKGKTIHLIQTNKFKTIHVIAKFKAPLERSTITKRALLPYILRQGTNASPNRSELEDRLNNLYGAGLGIDSGKRGNQHIISFRFEIPNEKFIPNAGSMLDDAFGLFREVIYSPNVVDGAFSEDTFNREKETLRQRIKSVIDDKMSFAQMRLIDEMCKKELYSLHLQGYEEDLDVLTGKELYEYYLSMLKTDEVDIYVLGDIDEGAIKEKLTQTFGEETRNIVHLKAPIEDVQKEELIEKVEHQEIQQAKLHIGYRTSYTSRDNEYAALLVYNGLFGGFPNSKLFINVREKNSLAYYAASRLESYKGLLFVFSGIAPKDYEKAREIIELQFEDMKQGKFTEDELQETKDLLVNDYLETLDSPQGIVELLYQQVLISKKRSPEELIEEIRAVSKDDVVKVASKITEDTVYLLTANDRGVANGEVNL